MGEMEGWAGMPAVGVSVCVSHGGNGEGVGRRVRGRKKLLKCEFRVTKETRTAVQLVIGLAPFPKLPPPHPSISHFSIELRIPPLHLPRALPVDWLLYKLCCFLGFAGAWRSMRDGAGGSCSLWQTCVGD